MTAASPAAVGTYLTGTSTTAPVAVPAGVVAGSIIIVPLYLQTSNAVTPPAGFTEATNSPVSVASPSLHFLRLFWKRATAADSGTYTFTYGGVSIYREGVAIRFTGAFATGDPTEINATAARTTTTSGVTPAVSGTTAGPDRRLIWVGTNFTGGTWTAPSGLVTAGSGSRMAVATAAQAAQGATPSLTGTCTGNGASTAMLLALDPAVFTQTVQAGTVAVLPPPPSPAVTTGQVVVQAGTVTALPAPTGPALFPGTVTVQAGTVTAPTPLPQPNIAQVVKPGAASTVAATPQPALTTTPRPPLRVDFWALADDGSVQCPLPDVVSWDLTLIPGEPGAVKLEYPADGLNYAVLRDGVTRYRDLRIHIRTDGTLTGAFGVYLTARDGDDTAEQGTVTFSGSFNTGLLTQAGLPYNYSNSQGETVFSAATAGGILGYALTASQAVGDLAGLHWVFTSLVDSRGTPWPGTDLLSPTFSPGKTILELAQQLRTWGILEFEVTTNLEVRAYVPATVGADHTLSDPPLVLHAGRDLLEAPRRIDVSGAVTDLLVIGADGVYVRVFDATARAQRGRQITRTVSEQSLTTMADAQAYGQRLLATLVAGSDELTHTLTFDQNLPTPLRELNVSDWFYSDTGQGGLGPDQRIRVAQLTVSQRAGDDTLSGSVVGTDLIDERVTSLQRQIDRLTSGSTAIGTSTTATADDGGVAPEAPTGLVANSVAYQVGGVTFAAVSAGWAAVTLNTDGTACTDLAGYRVQWRPTVGGAQWVDGADVPATSASFGGVDAGTQIFVQVAAYDRDGHQSPWSTAVTITTQDDTTPPPVPSAPIVSNWLGVLIVRWDGLGSFGESMPPDFDRVDVHISTSAGFTPSSATLVQQMRAAGEVAFADLVYATTYYFRLVAVDEAGNASAGSAAGSDSPQQVVGPDLANGIIDNAKLTDGAVFGPKIAVQGVTTAHLSVATFGDNDAVNGGFEDVSLTDPTKPAGWTFAQDAGTAVALDTTAANVSSGVRSEKVSLTAGAVRHVEVQSAWIPTRPGELWYMEVTAVASRAHAGMTITFDFNSAADPNTGTPTNSIATLNAVFPIVFTQAGYNAVAPATVSSLPTRWVRFKVEARNNDSAALDVWWDEVRARKVIGTAEIADASIVNAKIANLAVQDANVANLNVGKLVSGTGTFAMIMASGNIRSGDTGQRFILDPSGMRFYNSAGVNTVDINNVGGTNLLTGTLRTGLASTRRVELNGTANELRFYPGVDDTQSTRMYSFIDSVTTKPVVELRGTELPSTTVVSRVRLASDFVQIGVSPKTPADANMTSLLSVTGATTLLSASDGVANTAGVQIGSGSLTFTQSTLAGLPRSQFQQSPDDIRLEIRESGTVNRDGGFLWLGRGNSGLVYWGRHTAAGIDSYITIDSAGGVQAYWNNNLRWQFGFDNALLVPQLWGTNSGLGFRASIKAQGRTNPVCFFQSGATLQINDDTTGAFIKTFVIDHPTDSSRLLQHGVTESPHAGVEYWGEAVVEDGEVTVDLPAYFEALTRKGGRMVQVTVLAEDDPTDRLRLPRRTVDLQRPAPEWTSGPDPAGAVPQTAPPGLPSHVQATYPRDGKFVIYSEGAVRTFRVWWLVKAIRGDVAELDVEPLKTSGSVRGDGPYTYLVKDSS
jgi:hypothetical protein